MGGRDAGPGGTVAEDPVPDGDRAVGIGGGGAVEDRRDADGRGRRREGRGRRLVRRDDQPAKVLKTKLQLTDRDTLDAARLLELAAELVGFANSLDQLVWATWKQVAPKSDMKRPTPIQRSCAKFAAGDTEVSRTQIAADVDRLRQLTAGVISAIAQAGNLFAQKHVGKFSVNNIEAYADKMPGMLVGKEVKCWRQYKELATAMDVQTIELEIQNAIAEYTETLIKGRSRA